MERIATGTAEADKHGTGRNGFTYGDPTIPTDRTEVSDVWLDSVQEALANTVELDGKTLDQADHFQVADTVLGMLRDILSSERGWAATGLVASSGGGLTLEITDGVFYANGRRYQATNIADLTLADNDVRYIYAEPDVADERGYTIVDGASLSSNLDAALIARVTTSGGSITEVQNWTQQFSSGTRWETSQVIADRLVPNDNASSLGFSSPFLGHAVTGRWANAYLENLNIGPGSDSGDSARNEETHEIIQQTVSGAGTDTEILIGTSGYANGDHVTVEVKVSGRRTDTGGFGYSAHMTFGAQFNSGAWSLDGLVTVHHEQGDGGGARDLRPVIDGSDRVTLLMDIDNAEDWQFTSKVNIVWNIA